MYVKRTFKFKKNHFYGLRQRDHRLKKDQETEFQI